MNKLAIILGLMLATVQLSAQFVEEKKIREDEVIVKDQLMSISVMDGATKQPIKVNVKVDGLNPRRPVVFPALSDTIFPIKNYRRYTITCVEAGYMFYSKRFWPVEKSVHEEGIMMAPLAIGQKAEVPGIQFLGDKTEIYYKSKPSLDELIRFLEINPEINIAVIGHVNAPDPDRSDRFYVKASKDRADAVMNYLVENGISENRLNSEGMGNRDMVYPDPITDWQNDANRRVEIRITSL